MKKTTTPRYKPSHIKGKPPIKSGKHSLQTINCPRQRSMIVTVTATVMGEAKTFLTRIHRHPTIVMDKHVHRPDTVEKVIKATEFRSRQKYQAWCYRTGEVFTFSDCRIIGVRPA